MKVFVCFTCSYDGAHSHEYFEKIFLNEEDAMNWQLEVEKTDFDWRTYEEVEAL